MEIVGKMNPTGIRFAVVVSRFNELITNSLLEGALNGFERFNVTEEQVDVVKVPGAFEIPLIAKQLAESNAYDAIICLGCLIRGATDHYDLVANQTASGIANLSLQYNIPIVFQILTTDTIEQAMERAGSKAGNKGFEAILTAIEMADLMKQLANEPITTRKTRSSG